MIIKEIYAKTILSKSKVLDYVINPYVGCEHGCTYCYARYIKRFTNHMEPWGEFVDVKINAPTLLQREIRHKKVGRVWVSGLCDPYQPLERRYNITRRCIEILLKKGWPVTIQTKSTLILRDMALLKGHGNVEVILTITTADEGIKQIFEPKAPSIKERLDALEKLHSAGIKTCVMIAPLLPKAEGLIEAIVGKADYVLVDKMNYQYANWIYRRHGLEYAMTPEYFQQKKRELTKLLEREGLSYEFEF
ncbi:radical SAM protein [Candidatus Bathyarchaeota archaeon]|nr:radical SAM protein [Candidatus Bathyarchaeota archaeon]